MERRTASARVRGWVILTVVAAVSLAAGRVEGAERSRPVGFLGFMHHASNQTPMRLDRPQHAAEVVEALRGDGLNVLPATASEQELRAAELALGGDVVELECLRRGEHLHCRLGVTWKLFEGRAGKEIYTVTTRAVQYGVERKSIVDVESTLLAAALSSLLSRPEFEKRFEAEEVATPTYPRATFKRCSAGALQLPRQAEEAIRGAVSIEGRDVTGSGFFISADGLVLTAAHVASVPDLKVTLADGRSAPAGLVRINPRLDVALLRVADLTVPRCFEPATSVPPLGSEVYAIGSPLDARLAFSLSRGIVSGVREHLGKPLLQTDAPLNPGNSGGPLLGSDGRALAVVVRKLSRQGFEGIGFAVPVPVALEALSLAGDAASSPELAVLLPPPEERHAVADADDPPQSLDPPPPPAQTLSPESARELERQQTEADRRHRESGRLPGHVGVMRWGGLALGATGLVTALASGLSYDKNKSTQREYETLLIVNGFGWGATLIGGALFGWSFAIDPEPPASSRSRRAPRRALSVHLSGRF